MGDTAGGQRPPPRGVHLTGIRMPARLCAPRGTARLRSVAQALMAPAESRALGIETGLLQLKSRPAPAHPGLVSRQRLVRRLVEAPHLPVALIVAPAGYGKTTVLSEWAARDGRPFAWVSVDAEDNDPMALLAAIALALDAVEPIGLEVFEALASRQANGTKVALQRLVQSLSRRELPAVLVLDDIQVVTPESRKVVMAISQVCGRGLQLALASRSDVGLPVARLRAHGNSIELRSADLAMTRSEAAELLQLAGVELAQDQVLTLVRRTEGWPAGLYLAALSLREQGGPRAEVATFAGDDRFVTEYVREQLLSGLPPDQLEFLTRSSVFDRLSAPVCDAVLGRRDSADMLARLARSNVMLVPLDRRGATYRYHELFAAVLRAEFRRLEPDRGAALHLRASAWCARHDENDRAIGHAIDGGDIQRAGRLLWDSALQHVARGQQRVVWDWLDRFTEKELANTPLLALVVAGTSLVGGDLYETERWTTLARRVADDTDVVQAGLAVMQAGTGRAGLAEIGADATRAEELLQATSPWRPLCLLLQGVALHLVGDSDEARGRLEKGAHLAAASAPLVQALCLAQLALLAAGEDDRERALLLATRATAQVARCALDDCPTVALVFAASAELRAQFGQVSEATAECRQAARLLARITDPSPWYEVECRIALGRATLRLRGPAAAGELLAQATRALRRTPDAAVLYDWLEQALAARDLALGSTDGTDWSLTTAELRVLRFLPSYLSFREIAERLHVSPNTVKTHARGIYRKLDVSSRGNAVDRACDAGLVDPNLCG
jgi:LuxR family transcriptional regulator, maltose regulon positive regulatory protein